MKDYLPCGKILVRGLQEGGYPNAIVTIIPCPDNAPQCCVIHVAVEEASLNSTLNYRTHYYSDFRQCDAQDIPKYQQTINAHIARGIISSFNFQCNAIRRGKMEKIMADLVDPLSFIDKE